MIRFHLFRIPVSVEPFFWITMGLIGLVSLRNVDSAQGILLLALFVLAGFVSILVHEFGHAGMARAFGSPTEIVLQAFGGYATFDAGRMTRRQGFFIVAAGPALQLLLGFLAGILLVQAARAGLSPNVLFFLKIVQLISYFWAVLNLIPVLPLDGGQMLNAVLGPARIRTTLTVSMYVGAVGAIVMFLKTGSFIFPVFLGMFAWQAFQQLRDMR